MTRDEASAILLSADILDMATKSIVTAARIGKWPVVYPGYIAIRIRNLMRSNLDPEGIIRDVGNITPIGDARHALSLTDTDGNRYRVTVEVVEGES